MGIKTLILGDSGTGKSASLRNFDPEEVLVINCANKQLPFKNHFEVVTPSFDRLTRDVLQAMDSTNKKVIIIDDAQYIMSFQYLRRIKDSGWDKWNDIQGDFFNIIKHVDDLPADVSVYFLSHLQRDDEGHEKIKTMGKMLDEKITIEGLFTTVLKTSVKDGTYCFLTQNSGLDTVKSPIGMFDSYAIDNDLKYVDTKIRNYYEVGDYVPDDAVKELDEEAAKPEVEKPAGSTGRRRKARSSEGVEMSTEQPAAPQEGTAKRRRRKESNGTNEEEKPEEAPAEEKKEEAAAEAAEDLVMGDPKEWTGAKDAFDKAKRRSRKRANRVSADDFMNIPEVDEDEIPFC